MRRFCRTRPLDTRNGADGGRDGRMITATIEPRAGGRRAPAWGRTFYVDEGSGEAYLPAALAGDEAAVLLCACFDAQPLYTAGRHAYAPLSWLRREYPGLR